MSIYRCPSCQMPLTDAEWHLGKCAGCGLALPNAAAEPVAPKLAPEVKATAERDVWITRALIIGAFLLSVSLIIFQRPAPAIVESNALTAQDLEKLEHKLQRLEDAVNTNRQAKNGELKALTTRLDTLDTKIAELIAKQGQPSPDGKTQAEQLARVEAKLEALAQRAFAPPPPPGPLDIKVLNLKDWGDAVPENVQAVCISAAGELWQHFPDRRMEPITVVNSPRGPMVQFGRGPDGERRVLIQIKGRVWAQCAYQFSHEFCHILCNYREGKNANHWFEEALCETASLYALRRMAKTWTTKPPYVNWKSYSGSLSDYADETVRMTPPLDNLTLAAWYAKNEPTLRTNGVDRPRNRVVALALLKLLEREPHHWQAVGYLNQWDLKDGEQSFALYLSDWHRRVPAVHQPFVKEVAKLFEIPMR